MTVRIKVTGEGRGRGGGSNYKNCGKTTTGSTRHKTGIGGVFLLRLSTMAQMVMKSS